MKKLLVILLVACSLFGQATGSKGLQVIKHYESFRSRAYLCPAGVLTIGYGSTLNVRQGMVITERQADQLLRQDLTRFERHIRQNSYRLLKPHEFDGLSSFCFNVGFRLTGQLKTAVNSGNTLLAVSLVRQYNKAKINGAYRILPGLVRRRKSETVLYKDDILDFK